MAKTEVWWRELYMYDRSQRNCTKQHAEMLFKQLTEGEQKLTSDFDLSSPLFFLEH